MQQDYMHRCWAEIDLGAIAHNFSLVQKHVAPAKVMAVVKADAYGHGAVPVVAALAAAGATHFAVACYDEAALLRRANAGGSVLVLGYTPAALVEASAKMKLDLCVSSMQHAEELSAAACAANVQINAHFKVDTGMSRLGFGAQEDIVLAERELAIACRLPGLVPTGLFTHFAVSDDPSASGKDFTQQQIALLLQTRDALAAQNIHFPLVHCNNTAAAATLSTPLDIVRSGLALFGHTAASGVGFSSLRPALQLKAKVVMVKTIQKGDTISYGRTFTAPTNMQIATISAGYADGYPRALSGMGVVSIHGKPAPQIGRVCMDQLMVDVSNISNVQMGDTAVLFGASGSGGQDTVLSVAHKCNTIPYNITCGISRRPARVYTHNGKARLVQKYSDYPAETHLPDMSFLMEDLV